MRSSPIFASLLLIPLLMACTGSISVQDAGLADGFDEVDDFPSDDAEGPPRLEDEESDATEDAADSDDFPSPACDDGIKNNNETDVDCGGPDCPDCRNFSKCHDPSDCRSGYCTQGVCNAPPGAHPDIEEIRDVDPERDPGGVGWMDSYSVEDRCYCDSTFDHDIGTIIVQTPVGPKTVLEVCEAIGPGPGRQDRPIYNDIQCGNGPANNAGDEDWCPGRVDIGREGCGHIGPRWELTDVF